MNRLRVKLLVFCILVSIDIAPEFFVRPLLAQDRTVLISKILDPEPGGDGAFRGFGVPIINDAGQVAVHATLRDTSGGFQDYLAIYAFDQSLLSTVVRMGDLAPEGNGVLDFLNPPTLNNSGQIGFYSTLRGTSGGFADNLGIYRATIGGGLQNIVRAGQQAPDGNGLHQTFQSPIINDHGVVSFAGALTNTQGGFDDRDGIFKGSGGVIEQVARSGQSAPNGGHFGRNMDSPFQNNHGDVVFTSPVVNDPGNILGVFLASPEITQVVSWRQQLPGTTDSILGFSNAVINDNLQIAFTALIEDENGVPVGRGVYLVEDGVIQEIHRSNAPQLPTPVLNDNGQVAFDTGIQVYRGGVNGVSLLAQQGQPAPDNNGTFLTFSDVAINDSGLVAFRAVLENTQGGVDDNVGLFVSDGVEIVQVARTGRSLDSLGFLREFDFDRRYGFNNNGLLVFNATTSAWGGLIAMWTPSGDVESVTVVKGLGFGGSVDDIQKSNNSDFRARRDPLSANAVVQLEFDGSSPTANPTQFLFSVESSSIFRSTVTQTIELFDYSISAFEPVDLRDSSQMEDATAVATGSGDLSRFVEPGTGNVKTRVTFNSSVARQSFSVAIDHAFWLIN